MQLVLKKRLEDLRMLNPEGRRLRRNVTGFKHTEFLKNSGWSEFSGHPSSEDYTQGKHTKPQQQSLAGTQENFPGAKKGSKQLQSLVRSASFHGESPSEGF